MIKEIVIGDFRIGKNNPPIIIAEMSGNHNQSLSRALELVEAAKNCGADALKLQTYTPDTMTLNIRKKGFYIKDHRSLWNGRYLYGLYQEAHTPWAWHKPIFDRCKKLGILVFSTPFDETSVDFLESLNVPCYKIASFENVDLPLIRRVAETGKPMIISTGLASEKEIREAVAMAKKTGCRDIVLLKCTSSYPAEPLHANIRTIPYLQKRFNCNVGLSDHTLGIGAAVAGVALGAQVIEKHFTLSRKDGGADAAFSLEPQEMKLLVSECKQAWQALGKVSFTLSTTEKRSKVFRRSLYVVRNLKKGEPLTKSNLRSIRPGFGIAPKYLDTLIGKKVNQDISLGTPFKWGFVE